MSAETTGTDLPPQDDIALKHAVESETRDAAMKKLIIEHMNEDHTWSLQVYLRHYCGVSADEAASGPPQMTDVTTEHMLIQTTGTRTGGGGGGGNKVYKVPFEPPMKTLGDARERVVEMHHTGMRALDLSDVVVTTFAPPNKLWQFATNAAALLCFTTFPFRSALLPATGSVASQIWSLGGTVPGLAALAYRLNPAVLVGMVAIHSVEAAIFARTRLRKHRVPPGSRLWFMWMVHVLLGGIACFNRFDDLVSRLAAERKRRKMEEKH